MGYDLEIWGGLSKLRSRRAGSWLRSRAPNRVVGRDRPALGERFAEVQTPTQLVLHPYIPFFLVR